MICLYLFCINVCLSFLVMSGCLCEEITVVPLFAICGYLNMHFIVFDNNATDRKWNLMQSAFLGFGIWRRL